MRCSQGGGQRPKHCGSQFVPDGMHLLRVDIPADGAGDLRLPWQGEGQRLKGVIEVRAGEGFSHCGAESRCVLIAPAPAAHRGDCEGEADILQRLPAVEGVAVVPGQEQPVLL